MNNDRAIVTIGKDVLAALPAAVYKGKVKIIDNASEVAAAIKELRRCSLIGFDTETRPSFRKGQSYNIALIQLSSPDCCYLFRTNLIGFPPELINILEDETILKVGVSVHDDFHNLNKAVSFTPHGFIDLQSMVREFRIADSSLSRLYGILFGERISKGQRLSNWEASELTEAQIAYAALDAHACVLIYNYLKAGKFNPLDSPYLTIPPDPIDEEESSDRQKEMTDI